MSSQLELPAHVLTPLWPESVFCVPLRISWFAMAAGYQRLADVQAVLVISQPWSDMIRSGFKTMELRSSSFRKYEGQWIGLATSSIEMALCRIKHRACSSPCRSNPTQSSTTIEVQSKWRCAELSIARVQAHVDQCPESVGAQDELGPQEVQPNPKNTNSDRVRGDCAFFFDSKGKEKGIIILFRVVDRTSVG
jgi:hypothetical protein